jgi:hypothetical protein
MITHYHLSTPRQRLAITRLKPSNELGHGSKIRCTQPTRVGVVRTFQRQTTRPSRAALPAEIGERSASRRGWTAVGDGGARSRGGNVLHKPSLSCLLRPHALPCFMLPFCSNHSAQILYIFHSLGPTQSARLCPWYEVLEPLFVNTMCTSRVLDPRPDAIPASSRRTSDCESEDETRRRLIYAVRLAQAFIVDGGARWARTHGNSPLFSGFNVAIQYMALSYPAIVLEVTRVFRALYFCRESLHPVMPKCGSQHPRVQPQRKRRRYLTPQADRSSTDHSKVSDWE